MTARRRNTRARTEAVERPQAPKLASTPPAGSRGPHRSPQGALPLSAAQLMTADELAVRWQVPKTQVWRLARDGQVPVVRIGRYMRFRRDSIERWEEAQTDA